MDPIEWDGYVSAAILALLVLAWGAISLLFVPRVPFFWPNLIQSLVSGAALIWLAATWRRPRRWFADGFIAVGIAYALIVLPWTVLVWSRLGRAWEALTVPQIATMVMALVLPSRLRLGAVLLSAFMGETLFGYFYARHVGAAVPVNEPLASLYVGVMAIGLLMMRCRRRELVRQHTCVRAEMEALGAISPVFAAVRDQLNDALGVIPAVTPRVRRALDRLDTIRCRLDRVLRQPIEGRTEAEERLRAFDAQLMVTSLLAVGVILGTATILFHDLSLTPTVHVVPIKAVLDWVLLGWMLAMRRKPSERRAVVALLLWLATFLPTIYYNQIELLQTHRPYTPFVGYKLLMVALGFVAAFRVRLGVLLIGTFASLAIAEYFLLDLGAHKDQVPLAEPWDTLVYLFVALVVLRLREQRLVASASLLRAETCAAALRRHTSLFLTLRDRLNSPLQTLVLCAGPSEPIDQLVGLSRRLADLDH